MSHRELALALCLGSLVAFNGSTTPLPEGHESVTGTVVAIRDMTPVDGPFELELETAQGTREDVFLPSFFTPEPPPEESWELLRRLQGLEVGDRVRVVGVRVGGALEVSQLSELPPR